MMIVVVVKVMLSDEVIFPHFTGGWIFKGLLMHVTFRLGTAILALLAYLTDLTISNTCSSARRSNKREATFLIVLSDLNWHQPG